MVGPLTLIASKALPRKIWNSAFVAYIKKEKDRRESPSKMLLVIQNFFPRKPYLTLGATEGAVQRESRVDRQSPAFRVTPILNSSMTGRCFPTSWE